MGYTTVKVPDTSIEVFDEKTLDDKFKPEATWMTAFLKDKKRTEVVGKTGDLVNGTLKIKTNLDTAENIPLLIYVMPAFIESIKEFGKTDLAIIKHLRNSNYALTDRFYKCEACGGYIKGQLEQKDYDDIGPLSGSAGVEYNCIRCGTTLAQDAHTFS